MKMNVKVNSRRRREMLLRRFALRKVRANQVSVAFTTGILHPDPSTTFSQTDIMNRNAFAIQARVLVFDWTSLSPVILTNQLETIPANTLRRFFTGRPANLLFYEVVVVVLNTSLPRGVFNHFGLTATGDLSSGQTVLRGLFRPLV